MGHFSGQNIDLLMGDLRTRFDEVTLSIEDGRSVAETSGIPDGPLGGKYAASGDVTISTKVLNKLIALAKSAGSFTKLPLFDFVMNADDGDDAFKIEAFGCMIKISDLLNAKSEGGEKLTHKLPYLVTSSDFVHINGVPYIDPELTKDI